MSVKKKNSDNESVREMQRTIPISILLFLFYLRKWKKTEKSEQEGEDNGENKGGDGEREGNKMRS